VNSTTFVNSLDQFADHNLTFVQNVLTTNWLETLLRPLPDNQPQSIVQAMLLSSISVALKLIS
jgi:hypothetical protein